MKMKELVPSAQCLVLSVALCAVGFAAFAGSEISAVSAEGFLDLTVGDRVAKDVETLVVDPAWGEAETAWVKLQNGWTRTYTCASNDLWDTTALEPGRHGLAFRAGETDVIYGAFSSYSNFAPSWTVSVASTVFVPRTR